MKQNIREGAVWVPYRPDMACRDASIVTHLNIFDSSFTFRTRPALPLYAARAVPAFSTLTLTPLLLPHPSSRSLTSAATAPCAQVLKQAGGQAQSTVFLFSDTQVGGSVDTNRPGIVAGEVSIPVPETQHGGGGAEGQGMYWGVQQGHRQGGGTGAPFWLCTCKVAAGKAPYGEIGTGDTKVTGGTTRPHVNPAFLIKVSARLDA